MNYTRTPLYSNDVCIRPMTTDDLTAVLEIEKESFPTPWTEGMFREELGLPFCHDLVAAVDDIIAGYMSFAVVYDEIHLRNIAVHRSWKGRGIASKLIDEMMRIGSGKGALWATLEVRKRNEQAIKLYKKLGFVVKGIRPRYYTDTHEDALILWARVSGKKRGQK